MSLKSLKKYLKRSKKDYGFDKMIIGNPYGAEYVGGYGGHLPKYFDTDMQKMNKVSAKLRALKHKSNSLRKTLREHDYKRLFGGKLRKTRKTRKSRKVRKSRK